MAIALKLEAQPCARSLLGREKTCQTGKALFSKAAKLWVGREAGEGRPGELTGLSKGPKGTGDGPPNGCEGRSGQGEPGVQIGWGRIKFVFKSPAFPLPKPTHPVSHFRRGSADESQHRGTNKRPCVYNLPSLLGSPIWLYRREESGKPCPSLWYHPPESGRCRGLRIHSPVTSTPNPTLNLPFHMWGKLRLRKGKRPT